MTTPVDFPATSERYQGMRFTAEPTVADYYWDKNKGSWIFLPEQANGGRVTISAKPPSQRESLDTDLWIDANDYSLYVYDGNAQNWVGLTNFGITASVYVGNTPPLYQQPGALWFDNNTGDLKVSYEDTDSKYWVALTGNGINQEIASGYTDITEVLDGLTSRVEVLENGDYFSLS